MLSVHSRTGFKIYFLLNVFSQYTILIKNVYIFFCQHLHYIYKYKIYTAPHQKKNLKLLTNIYIYFIPIKLSEECSVKGGWALVNGPFTGAAKYI